MRNMNQIPGNGSSRSNNMQNSCGNCNVSQGNMANSFGGCNTSRNNNLRRNCDCEDESTMSSDPLRGMPLAIGYVPWQQWGCIYDYAEALSRGTIFPPLDLPFYGCIPRGFHTNKGGNA